MTKSLKTLRWAMMTASAIIVTLYSKIALAWPHPIDWVKRTANGIIETGKDTYDAKQATERFARHSEQYVNELGFADLIGRNFQHRAFILLTWMGISLLLSGKKREQMSGFGLWFCTVVGYAGGVVAGGVFELYRSSGQLSEYVQWAWLLPGVVLTGGITAHGKMLLSALKAFSPRRFHYYLWPLWIGVSGLDIKEAPATPPTPSKETEGPHVLHVEAVQPSAPTPEVPAVTADPPPMVVEAQPAEVPIVLVELMPSLTPCPFCKGGTRPGAKFCGHCSAPLTKPSATLAPCPSCGQNAKVGAKFCGHCGSVQAEPPPVAPVEPTRKKSSEPSRKGRRRSN